MRVGEVDTKCPECGCDLVPNGGSVSSEESVSRIFTVFCSEECKEIFNTRFRLLLLAYGTRNTG